MTDADEMEERFVALLKRIRPQHYARVRRIINEVWIQDERGRSLRFKPVRAPAPCLLAQWQQMQLG